MSGHKQNPSVVHQSLTPRSDPIRSAACLSLMLLSLIWLDRRGLAQSATAADTDQRPNIVFILADDLGWTDLGCYGSTFYETPRLDQLASEGARFTDAYAACPVCSPTRASIMTGKWPQRVGITDYIGAPQQDGWRRNTVLLPANYSGQLSHEELTLAEMLKQQGYATFFAGKWHLGPEGYWPEDQGFDVNRGGIARGGPYGGNKYFSPYGNPRLEDGPDGEHLPDRLARETVKFMEEHRDEPFLAYLSFYSVHTPLMARPDLEQKYRDKRERLGLEPRWGHEAFRDVRLVQEHPVYAGMVEALDQAVGKVLAAIDDLALRDRTIVMFTSDNGGLSTSEGWPTSNLPLRGGKGWLYEGGIREPLIVRWPGVTTPGQIVSQPVCSPDFWPTLADAAGYSNSDVKAYDGMDLRRFLAADPGADEPADPLERSLFWHYPHYGNQGGAPGGAIRRGPWKLVHWYEQDSVELYNLQEDPGETHDLATERPQLAVQLRSELDRWREEVGAVPPVTNPNYDSQQTNGRFARRAE